MPEPIAPTRRTARITVALCLEDGCFAAIPVEKQTAHAEWHERKRAAAK